jgi:hypothetical protein
MKKKYWFLLLLAIVLAVLWWYYRRGETEVAQREDASLLFNRIWVDSSPEKDTEYIHAMVLVTKLPIGVFQRASSYRFVAERFDYRKRGRGRIELSFPQSGKEDQFKYRIWGCDDLPPYDLCLQLSKNPWESGPKRFYAMRDQSRATEWHKALRRRVLSRIK